jgi:hypothetical protein
MKKNAKQISIRKMTLHHETIRNLSSTELDQIAGGIQTEATTCTPTVLITCHPKTPNCPI